MIKKAIKFLFNIPGKSFWAICKVVGLTLGFIFVGIPAVIVEWVQSPNENISLKEELTDLWREYVREISIFISEAIDNE